MTHCKDFFPLWTYTKIKLPCTELFKISVILNKWIHFYWWKDFKSFWRYAPILSKYALSNTYKLKQWGQSLENIISFIGENDKLWKNGWKLRAHVYSGSFNSP